MITFARWRQQQQRPGSAVFRTAAAAAAPADIRPTRRRRLVVAAAAIVVLVLLWSMTEGGGDDVSRDGKGRRKFVYAEWDEASASAALRCAGEDVPFGAALGGTSSASSGTMAHLMCDAEIGDETRTAHIARWLRRPEDRRTKEPTRANGGVAVAIFGLLPTVDPGVDQLAAAVRRRQLRSLRDRLLIPNPSLGAAHVVVASRRETLIGDPSSSALSILQVLGPSYVRTLQLWSAASIARALDEHVKASVPGSTLRALGCDALVRSVACVRRALRQFTIDGFGGGGTNGAVVGFDAIDDVAAAAATDAAAADAATFVSPLVKLMLRAASLERARQLQPEALFFVSVDIESFLYDAVTVSLLPAQQQPAAAFLAAHDAVLEQRNGTTTGLVAAELAVAGAEFALAVEEGPWATLRHYTPASVVAKGGNASKNARHGDDLSKDKLFSGTMARILRHPRYAVRNRHLILSASVPQIVVPVHGATTVIDGHLIEPHLAVTNSAGAAVLSGIGAFVAGFTRYISHLASVENAGGGGGGDDRAVMALSRFATATESRWFGYFLERHAAAAVSSKQCVAPPDSTRDVVAFYNTKHFSEEQLARPLLHLSGPRLASLTSSCLAVSFVDFHSLPVDFRNARTALVQTSLPRGSQTVYGRATRSAMQFDRMFCHRYRLLSAGREDAVDVHGRASMHPTLVGTVTFEPTSMDECGSDVDVTQAGGTMLVLRRASNVRFRCRTFVADFGTDVALLPNVQSARRGTCLADAASLPDSIAVFASPARDPESSVVTKGVAESNPFQGTVRCALCEHRDLTTAAVLKLEDEMLNLAAVEREHL